MHLLGLTAGSDLIESRANIKTWLNRVNNKKSACGQDVKAASFLPSAADMKAKKLPPIIKIEDF